MAAVLTTIIPEASSFSFEGRGDLLRAQTQVARQETFFVGSQTVVAAGAGDTRQVKFEFNLPPNFAFVCIEMSARIIATAGDLWEKQSDGTFANAQSGARSIEIPVSLTTSSTMAEAIQASTLIYTMKTVTKMVLTPINNESVQMTINFRDSKASSGAATFTWFARFLMYDVTQAHHYQVNSPTLTR